MNTRDFNDTNVCTHLFQKTKFFNKKLKKKNIQHKNLEKYFTKSKSR